MNDEYLDEEERDLIEALDDIDITNLSKPSEERQRMFKDAASEFRKKETKMNIRIDEFELKKKSRNMPIARGLSIRLL